MYITYRESIETLKDFGFNYGTQESLDLYKDFKPGKVVIFQLQSSVLAYGRSTRNCQEKKEIQPWVEKWRIWTRDHQISKEVPLITQSL